MEDKVIKVIAGGTLVVFGIALADYGYALTKNLDRDPPESAALVPATSTSGTVLIQDPISGEEIKLPRFAGGTVIKST